MAFSAFSLISIFPVESLVWTRRSGVQALCGLPVWAEPLQHSPAVGRMRRRLVTSWSLHTNQPQRSDWVFWHLQVQQLLWTREKTLLFISADVWNGFFSPIQIPWCGTRHVYRTTACCLLGYLGQCWNQLWQGVAHRVPRPLEFSLWLFLPMAGCWNEIISKVSSNPLLGFYDSSLSVAEQPPGLLD